MQEQIKLIKKLVLLIIPVILLIILFEVKARDLENGFTLKKSLLEKNPEDIQILILGSSHGYFSINPELVDNKSFNMAYFSQDLYYDYMLFDKYKSKLKNLKCIVLSLSYFSLWYDLNDTPEKWRKIFYCKYFDIKAKSGMSFADLIDIKSYSFAFFYTFDKTLYGTINKRLFSFGTKMNSLGWNTDTLAYSVDSTEDMIGKGKERVDFANSLINKKNYADNIKLIDELKKYATENNIKLVFVTTPVSYAYSLYTDKKLYSDFQKKVTEYTDNKNIFYLNYFSDNRFSMKDFYDYDHLNGKGATRFSRILKDTIESLKIVN
jgi:hypothetical protein